MCSSASLRVMEDSNKRANFRRGSRVFYLIVKPIFVKGQHMYVYAYIYIFKQCVYSYENLKGSI